MTTHTVSYFRNHALHLLDQVAATGEELAIALPSGVFKPYSGVGTAILIFQKGRATESVWFYELTADGFSLDDKRTEQPEKNDIPDILAKWPGREKGPNSFRVDLARIRENNWQLMVGRYKPVSIEIAQHDPPPRSLPKTWPSRKRSSARAGPWPKDWRETRTRLTPRRMRNQRRARNEEDGEVPLRGRPVHNFPSDTRPYSTKSRFVSELPNCERHSRSIAR